MVSRRLLSAIAVSSLAALALAGCVSGPDFHAPAAPPVDRFTPAPLPAATVDSLQKFQVDGPVAAKWWTLFGSSELNAIEEEALRANPDLKAAEAALRQARELYLAQRGTLLPSVDAAASVSRARNSAVLASPLANNAASYTLYQAQLNVGYDPDVFGGLKRQLETVAAQAGMQRFQTEAAYLTLTANVANVVVTLAGLQAQLDVTQKIIDANRRTLELTRRQQAAGQSAMTDVAAAETQVEQAEQLLPPLRKQIDQQRDMLAALAGRAGADAPAATFALADLTLPRDLPVSLPSKLVRQRPDILAAEANLHAASAQVGVAVAARLPDFALTGQLGTTSDAFTRMFAPANIFWSLTGGVTQKVFDAGQLKHRQKAAEAALDQAREQYRSTVLVAYQNTADVLQAIVEDANAYSHATATDSAAARSLKLANDQVTRGETGVLPLLTAQAAFQQAELSLVQARMARYADTIALFQSLGGGWWNDPERNADVLR